MILIVVSYKPLRLLFLRVLYFSARAFSVCAAAAALVKIMCEMSNSGLMLCTLIMPLSVTAFLLAKFVAGFICLFLIAISFC